MRKKKTTQGLTLQAIAGTHVVLLGIDFAEANCTGLRGFAVHRTDHTQEEAYWIEGIKTFEETDPGLPPGSKYSTREHPIQGFTWSDFSAKPGHHYTYRVQALKGTPTDLEPVAEVSVTIDTETPEGATHDIYFNRGAAASQEYARRFQNFRPEEIGPAAFAWLSRGLWESITEFIDLATGPGIELRVCAYEFHYPQVLAALKAAKKRGAKVRIIYDRRKDKPGDKNEAAVQEAHIVSLCKQRLANPSHFSQ